MKTILKICLIMFLPTFGFALDYEKVFGDWFVVKSSDGADLIATTINDAGGYIGFRCFSSTQKCVHVVSVNTTCTDGSYYPILINSDYSSMAMDVLCSKNGEKYELILMKFDEIHQILRGGTYIGFAIPMGSGLFKVSRFSLSGSGSAFDYVTDKAVNLKKGESFL